MCALMMYEYIITTTKDTHDHTTHMLMDKPWFSWLILIMSAARLLWGGWSCFIIGIKVKL